MMLSFAMTFLLALAGHSNAYEGLRGTKGESWQVRTLREKLLKLGAVVTRNTRRIKFMASSHAPRQVQELFWLVAERFAPSG